MTTDPTPLHADDHGVVRVGGTRMTLHVVIAAFLQGTDWGAGAQTGAE